jgi:hypothetical protein
MSEQEPVSSAGRKAGHESSGDVDFGAVIKFGIGLAVLGIVASLLLIWFLRALEGASMKRQLPPSPLAGEQSHLPPEPRLQGAPGTATELKDPDLELKGIREKEEAELNSFGWIDEKAGAVRLPIDLAKQKVLEKQGPSAASGEGKNTKVPGIELPTYASAGREVERREH